MANGNANGTHYMDTKHPPVNWNISATLSLTKTVTINAGTSVSDALDFSSDELKGFSPTAVFTAATWTSNKMAIQTSYDGINWFSCHQWFNGPFDTQNPVAPSSCHTIDGFPLRGMPYIRFVSGTNASPVNQTNTTVLTILIGTI